DEIGLAAQQQSGRDAGDTANVMPVDVLAIDRALRRDQLAVEFVERQAGREYRVLDVEQPVVASLQTALLGQPALGAGIGRVDADVDDFRLLEAPFADDAKTLMVPIGVGDQIDRDMHAERAGEFEGLEIAAERHALAVLLEAVFVDRLEAEKHVGHSELLPEPEYLLVAQQNIAAGLQVIAFLDAGPRHRLAELHAVALLHEGDIIDDEDARLADPLQILDDPLRAQQAIAAPVKCPGAAERAVPRTAARELDRGARIEHADEIFAPVAQQVARWQQIIERTDKPGRRPFAVHRDRAWHRGEIAA